MKKNSRYFPILFSSIIFGASLFSVHKSFVYADESLSTFQQDIIHSKQKYVPLTPKMAPIKLTGEPSKPLSLEFEAQKLMDDLVKKGYSAPPKSISIQQVEYQPVKLIPSSLKEGVLKNKPLKTVSVYKKPKMIIKRYGIFEENYDKVFSQGDSLYRVAVSDQIISMKEAQDIAVANSSLLLALKKKTDVAESKLFEAKRSLFPTLQMAYQENGGQFGAQGFYLGKNTKINMNQPLFYGGELKLTVKQAEENVRSSKKEYSKARGEIAHQVRTAYYGVVKGEYNVQYQADLFNRSSVLYERVKKEHANKVIPEIDYLNVESQYHQVHFQAESAQNDLLSARLLLAQAIGLDLGEKTPVDVRLDFVKMNPVFDEMVAIAFKNNPDIKIKEFAYQSAVYGVQIYEAKKLPRWDLRGSYGELGEAFKGTQALNEQKSDVDPEKEWYLGIKGSLPLWGNSLAYDTIKHVYAPTVSSFQGGSVDWNHTVKFNVLDKISDVTDAKSAEAAYFQAKSDYEKAKNEVVAKLREDFYNLQKSLITIDSAIAKTKYQEKQNSILEYMTKIQEAQAANLMEGWIEAAQDKFSFIQAVSDYKIALSSLSLSIGDPDYFENKS